MNGVSYLADLTVGSDHQPKPQYPQIEPSDRALLRVTFSKLQPIFTMRGQPKKSKSSDLDEILICYTPMYPKIHHVFIFSRIDPYREIGAPKVRPNSEKSEMLCDKFNSLLFGKGATYSLALPLVRIAMISALQRYQ